MTYRLLGLPRNFSAFGRVVEGVDLNKPVQESTVEAIKKDLHEHRLLVFRGQGRVSGQRQVEISRWFGKVESTFAKHPRSPDPDVFRVSNDSSEGCTSVGRSGWHIDGTFMEKPFKVQTMHFWSVLSDNQGGNTLFAPLKEIAEHLLVRDDDDGFSWKDLYFVTNRRTDYALAHPILCKHPVTAQHSCVFHLGPHFMDALVEGERTLSPQE
jgi:alpha-ketoglutarate-dependent taurine dioxygenase